MHTSFRLASLNRNFSKHIFKLDKDQFFIIFELRYPTELGMTEDVGQRWKCLKQNLYKPASDSNENPFTLLHKLAIGTGATLGKRLKCMAGVPKILVVPLRYKKYKYIKKP
ncbi:hypothetical protein [Pedobacter namyangjuensis]|uniref:hypothetical protein n=1 Tax=Pedobacter namyangjuensis TaxID=600626 RepID=UPI000DE23754|nr:hypothetical protein [Pedobacter namyangjuensis]